MDYTAAIERVYEHIENGHIDKAVMGCLRIARHLNDYLYAAIFLREMRPDKREFNRVFNNDTSRLKEDQLKFIYDTSFEYWINTHTLDFSLAQNEDGEERNVLAIGVGELDPNSISWSAGFKT